LGAGKTACIMLRIEKVFVFLSLTFPDGRARHTNVVIVALEMEKSYEKLILIVDVGKNTLRKDPPTTKNTI